MEKLNVNHIYSFNYDELLESEYYNKFNNSNFNYNTIQLKDKSLLTDYFFNNIPKEKISALILDDESCCTGAYKLTLQHDALSSHTKVCNLIKVNSDGLKSFNTFGPAFEKTIITQTGENLNGKNVLILNADTYIGKSIAFQSIWSNCKILTLVSLNPNDLRSFIDKCRQNTKNTVKSCALRTNKLKNYIKEADIIVDCNGYLSYNINYNYLINPKTYIMDLTYDIEALLISLSSYKLINKKEFYKYVAEYIYNLITYK